MSRPREFSNEAVFLGVYQALCRKGYARLTLADIADEIQVAPASLIKRFNSKKGVLLAYSQYVMELTKANFEAAVHSSLPKVEALKKVYKDAALLAEDPLSLSNHLSFYLESTADEELLEQSACRLRMIDQYTQQLLRSAIEQQELKPCRVEMISSVIQSSITGTMFIWVREPERLLEELIDECFRVILDPLATTNIEEDIHA